MKIYTSIIDYILNNYSQEILFAKYFKLPLSSIEYCLEDTTHKVNNPLRKDYRPSLAFMYKDDGKLISKDWSDDTYTGDIFDLVALLLGLNVMKSKEFMEICSTIINNNNVLTEAVEANISTANNKKFTEIRFKKKQYTIANCKYWTDGGVNLNHLINRNVFAAQYIWIEHMENPYYVYEVVDPAYVYYLGVHNGLDKIKVYRPNVEDKLQKFRTNNKGVFEAEHELYKADTLIIAKSRKDKLVIESQLHYDDEYVCDNLGVIFLLISASNYPDEDSKHKYCITSFNSESYRLNDRLVKYLKSVYNNIIIYVDYDKTGILNAFYHNVLYDIDCVFLGNSNNIYDEFTNKEIQRYFDKILLIDNRLTLFSGMLKAFIEEHSGNFKQKDLFEYNTVNGINKGEELINKLFKI